MPNLDYLDGEAEIIGLHELMDGSRTENYAQNEFTSTVNFICPWKYRYDAQVYLTNHTCPFHVYTPEEKGITGSEVSDLQKFLLGNDFGTYYYPAFCTGTSMSVFPEVGSKVQGLQFHTFIEYEYAKISANYKAFAKPSMLSIETTITPTIEARQLPTWGFFWASDRSPIEEDEAPVCAEYTTVIDITISAARRVPSWLFTQNGCINSNPVEDAPLAGKVVQKYGAGTLLFVVKSISNTYVRAVTEDNQLWRIQLEYNYNPYGWDSFRRPTSLLNTGNNMFHDKIITATGTIYRAYTPYEFQALDPNQFQ